MDDDIVFTGRRKGRAQNGQFEPGHSGNPSGRPRTKHQRALSSRQYRRDVLSVTEEVVPVRTAAGTEMMPFHVANLLAIRAKAIHGHAPSQRHIDKLHREAVETHETANPQLTRIVEASELKAVRKSVDSLSNSEWRDLNLVRKFSWRI